MFWNLVARITGKDWSDPDKVTPERLRHVFEWAELENTSWNYGKGGFGSGDSEMAITPEAKITTYSRDWGPYHAGELVHVPANLYWNLSGGNAHACLVGDRVVFRITWKKIKGKKARWPFTAVPSAGRWYSGRIAALFEKHYAHLGLPASLSPLRQKRLLEAENLAKLTAVPKLDALGLYLTKQLKLEDLSLRSDTLMWVDWRASDDEIVADCERLLKTGKLSAEFVENDMSADLFISYGAKRTRVPYPAPEADRDSTLIALNKAIRPAYELRFAVESDGGDTLGFVPLKRADWLALERDYSTETGKRFRPVAEGSRFFA